MDPTSRFFFLFPLTLMMTIMAIFVAESAAKSGSSGNNLLAHTCEHAVYKQVCVNTLKSDPASRHADLKGLASISLKHTSDSASNITYLIGQMLQKTTDASSRELLTGCSQNYKDAINQLKNSNAALQSGKYGDVNVGLQAAMSDAEACKDSFSGGAAVQEPMLDEQTTSFTQLCSNSLAIANMLSGEKY